MAMIARPGLDRAGEGDAAHQRMADQRRARLLAIAGDDIEHARREAGLRRELGEAQRGQRRLLGRLEHRRAAGGQRRRQRAGRHAERIVPGHDMGGDAERLQQREVDEVGPERDGRALHLVGGAGIVDQGRDDAVDVAARFLQRLADVERLQRAPAPPCAAAIASASAAAGGRARPA